MSKSMAKFLGKFQGLAFGQPTTKGEQTKALEAEKFGWLRQNSRNPGWYTLSKLGKQILLATA